MTTTEAARHLLDELEAGWLEVCMVSNLNGGYIRVPISVNAEWYSRFCAQYLSRSKRFPKLRTMIRRQHTIAALKRIEQGNTRGVYAERLLPFIEDKVQEAERCPAIWGGH